MTAVDSRPAEVTAVEAAIGDALDAEADRVARASRVLDAEPPVDLVEVLRAAVTSGGKRLRPRFCHWGYVGASGTEPPEAGARLGAALELLHTFALVHDDVMDGSWTRRGLPSVHAHYAAEHDLGGMRGERRRFSEGMAVLVGDLALALANRLAGTLPVQVQHVWHDMCSELVLGQYLDLVGAASGSRSRAYASQVVVLKSGRYTVSRPLHLGATLAGGMPAVLRALGTYGEAVGEAFQLRDDLLDVFGDPTETGKAGGCDLRAGKPTLLLAALADRAPVSAHDLLARVGTDDLGDDEVAELRDLAESTGARQEVERRCATAVDRALAAATSPAVHSSAQSALVELAEVAVWRRR